MNGDISIAMTAPQQTTYAIAELGSVSAYIEREPWIAVHVTVGVSTQAPQTGLQEHVRALSERLCEEHPAISTYKGIFGGIPHLKGLRIAVADILEQLYLTGSICAVQKIYSPDVSEEQIKEALAYAQDFVETVLCPSPEADG
jgi:uncharacterized protein (DUF433 family)